MKAKKHDWLMLLLVLPFALFGAIVLWIGAKDIEEHQQDQAQDTVILKTLEDSVHYYEDGM